MKTDFLSNTTAARSTKHLRKSRQKEALLSYIAHHCRMRECHMKEICAEFQITGLWLWLQSRLESALKKTCLNLWMVVFFHYFPGTMAQANFSSSSLKGPFVIFFLYTEFTTVAQPLSLPWRLFVLQKRHWVVVFLKRAHLVLECVFTFASYNGNKEAIMNGMIQSGWRLLLSM